MNTDKKGISLFIGAALLITIAISIAAVVGVFLRTTGQEAINETTGGEQIPCERAGVRITDAFFRSPASNVDPAGNYTTATVKNVGSVSLPKGVQVVVKLNEQILNQSDSITALAVNDEATITLRTNVTHVTEITARSIDCTSKSSTYTPVPNQTYIAQPSTGVQ